MLGNISIDPKSKTPIYLQITEIFISQIEQGILANDVLLPSINQFNDRYNVARDTIEKSYKELRKRGYIHSVRGKGYFVSYNNNNDGIKVLFIFNKISSFKRIIYYSFLKALGDKASVDLQIHHYNPQILKDILEQNVNKYNYFVIMPHFESTLKPESYLNILRLIPESKLILLDKFVPNLLCHKAVFQNFYADIYCALTDAKSLISKYKSIALIFPEYSNHPLEIIDGVEHFGKENKQKVNIIAHGLDVKLKKDTAYIVISDDDLVALIKRVRKSDLKIGKDIGIISFNESELKDLLDITVISTDFERMGELAAELILKNKNALIKNPFRIIRRGSL